MSDLGTAPVRRLLEAAVRAGSGPGLVAGWQSNGGSPPTIVTVGRAVVEPSSSPATPETWFDLASLTKPLVVGTLSLLAIRQGFLDLETRVSQVLSETNETSIGRRTARQLLTHSSGLPAWEPIYALAGGTPGRALAALSALPVAEADRHVVYSCPGFMILGMMLERSTGSSLDRLFIEWVAEPLRLEHELGFRPPTTHTLAGGANDPATERGLVADRGLDRHSIPATGCGMPDDGNARFLDGVSGNAGLFGTVAGVLALAKAYLGGGEFFSPDEISLATADHSRGLEQARGLGWQLASSPGCSAGPALAPTAFGHTGFTGTSLWVDPTRSLAMVLLGNRIHPGHRPTDLHPLRRRFHQLVVDNQT